MVLAREIGCLHGGGCVFHCRLQGGFGIVLSGTGGMLSPRFPPLVPRNGKPTTRRRS